MNHSSNHHLPPTSAGPPLLYGGAIALVLVMGLGVGFLVRHHSRGVKKEEVTRQEAFRKGPKVLVIRAAQSPPERMLNLQGEVRPYATVTLYAKISGYVRKVYTDKGKHVVKNQLLAEIESPELDRQYQAVVADARQKRATARRLRGLVEPGVVSLQDAEVAESQADVAGATVQQLGAQRAYERLRAPFAGTVIARYVDPGALVQSATSAQTSALPLVTVADISRLRVYVYVPQADAAFVTIGDRAQISLAEQPGRLFPATISRISGELDPRTRTMLAEMDVENQAPRGGKALVPGSFVQVALKIHAPSYVEVPSSSLLLRGEKPYVATVTGDDRLHLGEVAIVSDDGISARLLSGVNKGQRIALNLGDGIGEGTHIQPVSPPPPSGKPGGQKGPDAGKPQGDSNRPGQGR